MMYLFEALKMNELKQCLCLIKSTQEVALSADRNDLICLNSSQMLRKVKLLLLQYDLCARETSSFFTCIGLHTQSVSCRQKSEDDEREHKNIEKIL